VTERRSLLGIPSMEGLGVAVRERVAPILSWG
jgi:hypothetical protein